MKKLPPSFFLRDDVVTVAKELLGKVLVTNWEGGKTSGRIVETEAYAGESDRASHAFRGKTKRTGVMYEPGGRAYVYLCYGIHQMFNIVTGKEALPHAVLVRAAEPLQGIDIMLQRTGKSKMDETIARGPGNLGKAFGFHTAHTGMIIGGPQLYIADDGFRVDETLVGMSPRIGVDYAGDHAEWHFRFYLRGNKFVSGKNK